MSKKKFSSKPYATLYLARPSAKAVEVYDVDLLDVSQLLAEEYNAFHSELFPELQDSPMTAQEVADMIRLHLSPLTVADRFFQTPFGRAFLLGQVYAISAMETLDEEQEALAEMEGGDDGL